MDEIVIDHIFDSEEEFNKEMKKQRNGEKESQYDDLEPIEIAEIEVEDKDWIGRTVGATMGGVIGAVVGSPVPGGSVVLGTAGSGVGGMLGEAAEDWIEGDKPDGVINAGITSTMAGGAGMMGLGLLTKGLSTLGQVFIKKKVKDKVTQKALKQIRDRVDDAEYKKIVDKIRKTAEKKKLSDTEIKDAIKNETSKVRKQKPLTRDQKAQAEKKGKRAGDAVSGGVVGALGGVGQLGNAAITNDMNSSTRWDMATGKDDDKPELLSGFRRKALGGLLA